ncbi:NAD(P)/FAD-dependent oxidoreductase, partial [Paenibacillus polymyxa]|nr:NAD(P)/FAD-dependent oxidoreductase [Paenibacillus polymyxa]
MREQQVFQELAPRLALPGPAILQISSYWKPGDPIVIDLAPGRDLAQELLASKSGNRQQLHTVLAGLWPKRLADRWLHLAEQGGKPG